MKRLIGSVRKFSRKTFNSLVVVLFGAFLICGCSDNKAETKHSREYLLGPAFEVIDSLGKNVNYRPKANDKVFLVASWCPHSTLFVSALEDPRIKTRINDNLVFFMADELPSIKKQLEAGDYTQSQIDQILSQLESKEKYHSALIFDETFIESLPGKVYVVKDLSSIPGDAGFPTYYKEEVFNTHAIDYLIEATSEKVVFDVYSSLEGG